MFAMGSGGPVMQESSALNWAIPQFLHVRQPYDTNQCQSVLRYMHYSQCHYTLATMPFRLGGL